MRFSLASSVDYQVGRRIAGLVAQQSSPGLDIGRILSTVQDLMGADTSLLGPLRDLLTRPACHQLLGSSQHSLSLGGRDALLQDLAETYSPAVVDRLASVLNGALALPDQPPRSSSASSSRSSSYSTHPPYSTSFSSQPPQGSPPPPPPSYGAGQAQPPYQPQVVTIPVATTTQGQNATAVLIAVVSLLAGALIVGLGYALYLSSGQSQGSGQGNSSATNAPKVATASPPTTPPTQQQDATKAPDKTPMPESPSTDVAWGGAAEYKFGQLPGGDYPNSCAFSQTDSNAKVITDRTSMEYWACRDVGGDPSSGYTVVWADGKRTVYTFGSNGQGTIVGTNGSSYPITWSNDTHNGTNIIVVEHQDGARSWIPGKVGD